MYAFIEGQVCEKANGCLVLLAAGVGWQLICSNNTLQAAPAQGEVMRCYTVLNVREDAMELYGFATKEEKRMPRDTYAACGGGFPIRLKEGAVIGSICVSGLPDWEDHQVIVETLEAYFQKRGWV